MYSIVTILNWISDTKTFTNGQFGLLVFDSGA